MLDVSRRALFGAVALPVLPDIKLSKLKERITLKRIIPKGDKIPCYDPNGVQYRVYIWLLEFSGPYAIDYCILDGDLVDMSGGENSGFVKEELIKHAVMTLQYFNELNPH